MVTAALSPIRSPSLRGQLGLFFLLLLVFMIFFHFVGSPHFSSSSFALVGEGSHFAPHLSGGSSSVGNQRDAPLGISPVGQVPETSGAITTFKSIVHSSSHPPPMSVVAEKPPLPSTVQAPPPVVHEVTSHITQGANSTAKPVGEPPLAAVETAHPVATPAALTGADAGVAVSPPPLPQASTDTFPVYMFHSYESHSGSTVPPPGTFDASMSSDAPPGEESVDLSFAESTVDLTAEEKKVQCPAFSYGIGTYLHPRDVFMYTNLPFGGPTMHREVIAALPPLHAEMMILPTLYTFRAQSFATSLDAQEVIPAVNGSVPNGMGEGDFVRRHHPRFPSNRWRGLYVSLRAALSVPQPPEVPPGILHPRVRIPRRATTAPTPIYSGSLRNPPTPHEIMIPLATSLLFVAPPLGRSWAYRGTTPQDTHTIQRAAPPSAGEEGGRGCPSAVFATVGALGERGLLGSTPPTQFMEFPGGPLNPFDPTSWPKGVFGPWHSDLNGTYVRFGRPYRTPSPAAVVAALTFGSTCNSTLSSAAGTGASHDATAQTPAVSGLWPVESTSATSVPATFQAAFPGWQLTQPAVDALQWKPAASASYATGAVGSRLSLPLYSGEATKEELMFGPPWRLPEGWCSPCVSRRTTAMVQRLLAGRTLFFVGDSTIRQYAYAFGRLLNSPLTSQELKGLSKSAPPVTATDIQAGTVDVCSASSTGAQCIVRGGVNQVAAVNVVRLLRYNAERLQSVKDSINGQRAAILRQAVEMALALVKSGAYRKGDTQYDFFIGAEDPNAPASRLNATVRYALSVVERYVPGAVDALNTGSPLHGVAESIFVSSVLTSSGLAQPQVTIESLTPTWSTPPRPVFVDAAQYGVKNGKAADTARKHRLLDLIGFDHARINTSITDVSKGLAKELYDFQEHVVEQRPLRYQVIKVPAYEYADLLWTDEISPAVPCVHVSAAAAREAVAEGVAFTAVDLGLGQVYYPENYTCMAYRRSDAVDSGYDLPQSAVLEGPKLEREAEGDSYFYGGRHPPCGDAVANLYPGFDERAREVGVRSPVFEANKILQPASDPLDDLISGTTARVRRPKASTELRDDGRPIPDDPDHEEGYLACSRNPGKVLYSGTCSMTAGGIHSVFSWMDEWDSPAAGRVHDFKDRVVASRAEVVIMGLGAKYCRDYGRGLLNLTSADAILSKFDAFGDLAHAFAHRLQRAQLRGLLAERYPHNTAERMRRYIAAMMNTIATFGRVLRSLGIPFIVLTPPTFERLNNECVHEFAKAALAPDSVVRKFAVVVDRENFLRHVPAEVNVDGPHHGDPVSVPMAAQLSFLVHSLLERHDFAKCGTR